MMLLNYEKKSKKNIFSRLFELYKNLEKKTIPHACRICDHNIKIIDNEIFVTVEFTGQMTTATLKLSTLITHNFFELFSSGDKKKLFELQHNPIFYTIQYIHTTNHLLTLEIVNVNTRQLYYFRPSEILTQPQLIHYMSCEDIKQITALSVIEKLKEP
ncbi:MAG: hypothetical protein KIT27_09390 [Legionellales bacterium]|nr:hypothetical protein [Legionellales bacterium]